MFLRRVHFVFIPTPFDKRNSGTDLQRSSASNDGNTWKFDGIVVPDS